MKTGINKTLLIATLLTLPAWPLSAHQERYDPAERVVQDVLAFTLQRAADEILRVSRIDPVYQGYSRHYEIRHAPPRVDDRTRQQLRRLAADHQRKLASYERELDREWINWPGITAMIIARAKGGRIIRSGKNFNARLIVPMTNSPLRLNASMTALIASAIAFCAMPMPINQGGSH